MRSPGPHRVHALGRGMARHYPRDMAPFSAIAEPSEAAYADLAADLPAGTEARLFRPDVEPLPEGWEEINRFPDAADGGGARAGAAPTLSVDRCCRKPTRRRCWIWWRRPSPDRSARARRLLGRYLGIRHGDRLVAMAGERLRVPGYVELSAICVHPEARGKGYAAALTQSADAACLRRGGEVPFLHVRPDNDGCRRACTVAWGSRRAASSSCCGAGRQ